MIFDYSLFKIFDFSFNYQIDQCFVQLEILLVLPCLIDIQWNNLCHSHHILSKNTCLPHLLQLIHFRPINLVNNKVIVEFSCDKWQLLDWFFVKLIFFVSWLVKLCKHSMLFCEDSFNVVRFMDKVSFQPFIHFSEFWLNFVY